MTSCTEYVHIVQYHNEAKGISLTLQMFVYAENIQMLDIDLAGLTDVSLK
jgi:hypothetical protein